MAYTKLFNSIITSTIWTESDQTRIVWITLLACADRHGEVQASIPGLARIAGVAVEDCRTAIHKFLSPDPDSRTKDDEGRRIEEIDGGWLLINHQKYREMASGEDRKVQAVIRQRRFREKQSRNSNAPVTPCSRQICQADAEADAEAEEEGKGASAFPPPPPKPRKKFIVPSLEEVKLAMAKTGLPETEAEKFINYHSSRGWKVGGDPMVSWPHAVGTWKTNFCKFQSNGSGKSILNAAPKTDAEILRDMR